MTRWIIGHRIIEEGYRVLWRTHVTSQTREPISDRTQRTKKVESPPNQMADVSNFEILCLWYDTIN